MEILRLMAILLLIILVIVIGSKVIYKDDYAIISGTLTPDTGNSKFVASVAYPSGFNKSNCVVVSLMIQGTGSSQNWSTGSNFNTGNQLVGSIPSRVMLQDDNIVIETKNIIVYSGTSPVIMSPETSSNCKLVLMKID